MFRISGIIVRTTLLAWTVTLVTLGIFVVILIPEQEHDLREGLQSKALSVAAALQGDVAGAAISEDYSSVVDRAQQVLYGDKSVDFLVITKNDGFSVIVERNSWRIVPTTNEYWHPAIRHSAGDIERVPLFDQRLFHFSAPFDYSGLEWGWIHVGLSLDSYDNSVKHVYRRTAILAVICILLSLFASLLHARHFVGPILQLREVVEEVAAGDFAARAEIKGDDEIKQLADAFNDMADAILQRNRIVECVRFTAQSLQSTNEWHQIIEQVLTKIGRATDASRVLVGQVHGGSEEEALASVRFEWTAVGVLPLKAAWQNCNLAEHGLGRMAERLVSGEVIVARTNDLKSWGVKQIDESPVSEIITPVLLGKILWGALVVQDCRHDREWREAELDAARAVAEMLGASIIRQNAQQSLFEAKSHLELRVAERTLELQKQIVAKDRAHAELGEAQKRLIELSRLSGMAEVATGVLHNVGNILNSINVSTTVIADRLRASRITQLSDLSQMLMRNQSNIGDFLTHDPKGQRILPYIERVSVHLVNDRDELSKEVEGLVQHVSHVKEIVSMQQAFARTTGVLETLASQDLIEDALSMTQSEMDRHGVQIQRDINSVPPISTDRHKVLQILVNLLRNAKDSLTEKHGLQKHIIVRLSLVGAERVQFQLVDDGVGIPTESLARIFSHGFTTKRGGHGFGLHFAALTAQQLGGSLRADSGGLNSGATFTLELPLRPGNNSFERSAQ